MAISEGEGAVALLLGGLLFLGPVVFWVIFFIPGLSDYPDLLEWRSASGRRSI